MATIENARDILLQAANPRVAGVTQTNLTVDQSQVTGLGLVLSGVKRITTAISGHVFLVPSAGAVTPSSITVATTVSGFAAVPTMSILSGTISPVPTAVEGVFTIPASSMSSALAVVRVSATDTSVTPNVTYTDTFQLIRQVEGDTAVVGIITQEDIILPADFLGNVVSYFGASGNFKVYQGTNDITSLCTFSMIANPSGLTQTINATTGAYAVTAGMPSGTDNTSITYRATFGATTVDKTFNIQKSKAVQITQGSDGEDGTDGQRGSRTFYVTLTGSTNTFSDSLATTTASVDGGPVRNDVVTQSNSSMGFSQSKFWDGATWNIINAVVDGNLIVTGTIGAGKLSANSVSTNNLQAQAITTEKLLVTGNNTVLNADPNTQDLSAWTGGTLSLVSDAESPNGRALQITSSSLTTGEVRPYPIDVNKNYILRINAKRITGAASCYLGVDFLDINGNSIVCSGNAVAGTWPGGGGIFWYFGLVGQLPNPSNYIEYSVSFGPSEVAKIPAGARFARIIILGNYSGGAGTQRFANLRLMEKTTAALVVDGSITAQKIDSKGLTIKDNSGNVLFGVGSSVDVADYMSAAFGSNYVYNPDFANKADGWEFAGGAITQSSYGFDLTNWFPTGGHALWSTQGAPIGNSTAYYEWDSNKIPVEEGKRYVVSAYLASHRCKVAVFFYVFNSSNVVIANSYSGGDPENNAEATGGTSLTNWKRCYNYLTMPSGAAYVRVILRKYDTFVGETDSYLFATNVQFERATATAIKPGPYVATGWLDNSTVRSLNPITSSNVTTYIGNAAIDSAQINKLQTSNYAEDGSNNPTAGARLSSSGTAIKVASGSLQVGSVFFTDYWYRLINGIDGSLGAGAVVWRGNNDASTRSGAPNIACLTVQADSSTVTNSNTQHTTHRFKLTPTTYTNRTDNLDAMTQIHVQFFASTSASSPFDEGYFPCPSRTYDGVSGIAQGHWYKQWRYADAGAVPGSGEFETDGLYDKYLRVRIANTYGWSATVDYGPNSTRLANLPTTTITGVGGSSASGGGAIGGFCPAPWVKIRLMGGREIMAEQLYDGAKVEAVDDSTFEPKIGTVRYVRTVWKPRIRLKLTNGQITEWSEKHRFAVVDRGWIEIEKLLPGDHIMGLDEAVVESVFFVGEAPVVSFQVEGAGTYFGGGLLCHNLKSELP